MIAQAQPHTCHNCGCYGYELCPAYPEEPKVRSCKSWNKYPPCPKCNKNDQVTKNGSVERRGEVFQMHRCKRCNKSW